MNKKKQCIKERKVTDREIELLANAIVTQLEWQSRMLALKEERKVKAMITRQRNLALKKQPE